MMCVRKINTDRKWEKGRKANDRKRHSRENYKTATGKTEALEPESQDREDSV